ncbi:MAG: site-2 protease family protein [Bacteroidota bacterium]
MEKNPQGTWLVADLAGTRIFLHWSFLFLLLYVLVSEWIKQSSFYSAVLLGLLLVAVFATVILHELGHVLTAKRFGCRTKDIILLPIGGVARMERIPEKPLQENLVAIAGPAVNLIIASLLFIMIKPGVEEFEQIQLNELSIHNWSLHFLLANIALAVFNLLPAFPMDGGRVLRGLLSLRLERSKATVISARIGQAVAIMMFGAGLLFNPFLSFIGAFIFIGAQLEASSTMHHRFMRGATARSVTMHRLEEVEADSVLREVVKRLLDSDATRFIVKRNGTVVGHLDRSHLLASIERHGQYVFVEAIMNRDLIHAEPDSALEVLYQKLQTRPEALVIVQDRDGKLGYIDMENIIEFILVKQADFKNHGNDPSASLVSQTS